MTEYNRFIDPLSARKLAVKIASPYADEHDSDWRQAAAMFEYVKEHISYVPDLRGINYVAPPTEMVECGGGDCDDQAALVASLCEAVGLRTRLVLCRSGNRKYILSDVDFGRTNNHDVVESLSSFYQDKRDTSSGFHWEYDRGRRYWLVADTTMGDYFGDVEGLVRNGYINKRNHSWR